MNIDKEKRPGKKKVIEKMDKEKKIILLLAVINMAVIIVDKIIMLQNAAFGAPLSTVILWLFIYHKKYWAYVVYSVLAIIYSILGLIALICLLICIIRGGDPEFVILAILLGASYFFCWLRLRKILLSLL